MGQINILSTDGTHKAGLSFTGTSDISVDAGVGLGIAFPIACELGKILKFERIYDLKFIKLSFSPGWENQEIVYGAIQGAVLWSIILGVIQ